MQTTLWCFQGKKLNKISDSFEALLKSFYLGPIPQSQLSSFKNDTKKKPDVSKLKWENEVKMYLKIENWNYIISRHLTLTIYIHTPFFAKNEKIYLSLFWFVKEQNFLQASVFWQKVMQSFIFYHKLFQRRQNSNYHSNFWTMLRPSW